MNHLEPRRVYRATHYHMHDFNILLWLTPQDAAYRNELIGEENFVLVTNAPPTNLIIRDRYTGKNKRVLKGEDGKLYLVYLDDMFILEIDEIQADILGRSVDRVKPRTY